MRKALLIILAVSVGFSSCNDRNSDDIFDQLQDEYRFSDASFYYLYGSVLRALMSKVEAGDFGESTGEGTENLSAMIDGIEKVRAFRVSSWDIEKDKEYHERIYTQLEASGNDLLLSSSFGKGNMSMFIHDVSDKIDRFQILARLPEGGADLPAASEDGLSGTLSSWTSEKSLILIEVQGNFNKEDLGKMLMQLNSSLAE